MRDDLFYKHQAECQNNVKALSQQIAMLDARQAAVIEVLMGKRFSLLKLAALMLISPRIASKYFDIEELKIRRGIDQLRHKQQQEQAAAAMKPSILVPSQKMEIIR